MILSVPFLMCVCVCMREREVKRDEKSVRENNMTKKFVCVREREREWTRLGVRRTVCDFDGGY